MLANRAGCLPPSAGGQDPGPHRSTKGPSRPAAKSSPASSRRDAYRSGAGVTLSETSSPPASRRPDPQGVVRGLVRPLVLPAPRHRRHRLARRAVLGDRRRARRRAAPTPTRSRCPAPSRRGRWPCSARRCPSRPATRDTIVWHVAQRVGQRPGGAGAHRARCCRRWPRSPIGGRPCAAPTAPPAPPRSAGTARRPTPRSTSRKLAPVAAQGGRASTSSTWSKARRHAGPAGRDRRAGHRAGQPDAALQQRGHRPRRGGHHHPARLRLAPRHGAAADHRRRRAGHGDLRHRPASRTW